MFYKKLILKVLSVMQKTIAYQLLFPVPLFPFIFFFHSAASAFIFLNPIYIFLISVSALASTLTFVILFLTVSLNFFVFSSPVLFFI